MTCEEARVALGALVIGALDVDEAREVQAHLDECEECRAEYDELREMPRLLGLISLTDAINPPATPPEELRDELVQHIVAERRRESRRRLGWSAGGGVAIAAAAAAVGFGLAGGSPAVDAEEPGLQVLSAADPTTGVRGQVQLDGVGWGTKLELELAGVTAGEKCSLVAVSNTGARETTASWRVPDETPDDKFLTVPGAAGLTPDLIDALEIVTSDGTAVLSLTFADLVSGDVVNGLADD